MSNKDWFGDITAGISKGAALGSVVPGMGTGIGALAGAAVSVAQELLPGVGHLFSQNQETINRVAQTVQSVTGTTTPVVASLAQEQVDDLRIQLSEIAKEAQADHDNNLLQTLTAKLADEANARQREIELSKTTPLLAYASVFVDWFILLLFGACVLIVMTHSLPDAGLGRDLLVGFIGTVSVLATQIVQYHRGSSAGSAAKDVRLANSVPTSALDKPLKTESAS